MQYCSLQHRTLLLSPVPSATGYCFCFGSIHSFWSYFSTDLQQHIGHLPTWGVSLSVSYHFSFSYCSWVLKARILKWFAIPFSSGPHSVRPLHHDPTVLGGPTRPGLVSLSYTRLWSMWSDWLVFCDYGFSASTFWCPLVTPTVLLGFLLPGTWGISSRLLQQSSAAAPYLGQGVSSHGRPSWPWMWISSSQPSCARAAAAPWRWNSSSQAGPLSSGVG